MAEPVDPSSQPAPAPLGPVPARQPPARRRRWLLALLVTPVALLAAAAITIQVLLSTQLPRDLVLREAQRQLGLRMTARTLTTGWVGHTDMRDVSVWLPLAKEPFLEAPDLRISHTGLVRLLLGGELHIYSLALGSPTLTVRQSDGGSWNLSQVVQAVQQRSRSPAAGGTPELPAIAVDHGTVQIIDHQGRTATISPLAVRAGPQGPVLWHYDLQVPEHLRLLGELAPGGDWRHQLDLSVQNVEGWIRPWVAAWPQGAVVQANWRGRITDNDGNLPTDRPTDSGSGIAGELMLQRLAIGQYEATGALSLRAVPSGWSLFPHELRLRTPLAQLPTVLLRSGELAVEGAAIRGQQLQVLLPNGGQAQLTGHWNWSDNSAALQALWQDVLIPHGVEHTGRLDASLRTLWSGQHQVAATFSGRGHSGLGDWQTDAAIDGNGLAFDDMAWQVRLNHLAWQGRQSLDLSDLRAAIRVQGDRVTLEQLRWGDSPPDRLHGNGGYDLSTGRLWIWVEGRGLSVPRRPGLTCDAMLNVWGDLSQQQFRLEQLYLRIGRLELSAQGDYGQSRPVPLELDLSLRHPGQNQSGTLALFRGLLLARAHLRGAVAPADLTLAGSASAQNVEIRGRPLGDVAFRLTGQLDARQAKIRLTDLQMLGGRWAAEAHYPLHDESAPPYLSASVQALSLAQLGEVMQIHGLEGTLAGQWALRLPHADQATVDRLTGEGTFTAEGLALGPVRADAATGGMRLQNGMLTIAPIRLQRGEGRADAQVSLDVRSPQLLQAKLAATDWPLPLPPQARAHLRLWGQAQVTVDTAGPVAVGAADLRATASLEQRPLGELTLKAQFQRRGEADGRAYQVVRIPQIGGELLGGRLGGQALLDLGDPLATRAALRWEDLDGASLAATWPQLKGLEGRFTAQVQIERATQARPLAPMQLLVLLESGARAGKAVDAGRSSNRSAAFRSLAIGDCSLLAFFDRQRLILDRSDLRLAGGSVHLWADVVQRRGDGGNTRLSWQLTTDFERLDLDELVHAGEPRAEPMPGRLSGQFSLVGDTRSLGSTFGQGQMRISDSDLVNFDPLRALYNAMRLGTAGRQPNGTGQVQFRLEAATITISRFDYFNRGVEAYGTGSIQDIWQIPDCPLDGFVVGSARPLANLHLPLLADVDQVLAALQGAVTPVRISGTLRNPVVRPAVFSEIGAALRNMLLGATGQPR